jgi:hypothetical protein
VHIRPGYNKVGRIKNLPIVSSLLGFKKDIKFQTSPKIPKFFKFQSSSKVLKISCLFKSPKSGETIEEFLIMPACNP